MREPVLTPFTACLVAGVGLWWLIGGFLLLLTPLPAHTEQFGWSPLYWLALAPPCAVVGLRLRRARA